MNPLRQLLPMLLWANVAERLWLQLQLMLVQEQLQLQPQVHYRIVWLEIIP